MQTDLLTPRPRRLFRAQGRWVLEVVHLCGGREGVFTPVVQRVEGGDAIRRQLGEGHGAALGELLASPREDAAWELVGRDWVAIESPDLSPPRDAHRDLDHDLLDLLGEVRLLRRLNAGLVERVAALARGEVAPKRGSVRKTSRLEARRWQPEVNVAPEARPLTSSPSFVNLPRPAPAPPVLTPPREVSPKISIAPSTSEAPQTITGPRLQLPSARSISVRLKQVLGDDLRVTERRSSFGATVDTEHGRAWLVRLVDGEGEELGGVVADARAAARLGSMLLLLPDAEVEAAARSGTARDEAISVLGELLGMLSGAFNAIAGNPPVRAQPLEPYEPRRARWVASPSKKLRLGDGHGGHLVLVAR